ncbi:MAG TPA: hypothetical protein VMP01_26060 [Pirellulaceae bacterium]|nr:hypothetical protein [Pirellulaceae bacterium]
MTDSCDNGEIPAGESRQRRCPQCGASCAVEATQCWLCRAALPADVVGTLRVPSVGDGTRSVPTTFSLATILLVITLIAVCLGVFRLSPGFGIAVVCFAVPALIRSVVVGVQQKRAGERQSIGEKLTAFAASLGIMLLVGIAGFIAFQIACWGTCGLITATASSSASSAPNLNLLLWSSVGLGSLSALAVGIWILWLTRPRRR